MPSSEADTAVIDAMADPGLTADTGTRWDMVSDRVMGGVSDGRLRKQTVAGRPAVRLTGTVSLENNGGFLQMSLDLAPDRRTVDGRAWAGLELDVLGDGSVYNLHLRTADVVKPWQSYRQSFEAGPDWRTVRLPFEDFIAHRIDAPLDRRRLRRIGVVAIGREMQADVAVAGVRFYR